MALQAGRYQLGLNLHCAKVSLIGFFLLVLLAGSVESADPKRIVSLDYCSDQYLLKLADRENILAVSKDAGRMFSYMRKEAAGLPSIKPSIEDILLTKADLVIWSYAGSGQLKNFLERLGIRSFVLNYSQNLADIERGILTFGQQIGRETRAGQVVAEMRARLAEIASMDEQKQALYLSPSGLTAGRGTLVHNIVVAAGLENFETRSGWPVVALEQLLYSQPSLLVLGRFGADDVRDKWSAIHHPVVHDRLLRGQMPSVSLPGAWLTCGAWFVLDAVETLAAEANQL